MVEFSLLPRASGVSRHLGYCDGCTTKLKRETGCELLSGSPTRTGEAPTVPAAVVERSNNYRVPRDGHSVQFMFFIELTDSKERAIALP